MKRLLAIVLLLSVGMMLVPSVAWAEPKKKEEEKDFIDQLKEGWDQFTEGAGEFWDKSKEGVKGLVDGEKKKKKGKAQVSEAGKAGNLLIDNLIPDDKKRKKVGNVVVIPNNYSPSRYQLDLWVKKGYWIDDAAIEGAASTWHGFNNGLWSLNVSGSYIIYWLMDEFQKTNVIADSAEEVENIVQTMAGFKNGSWTKGQGIWGMLFPIMLMLAAGYIGWKAIGQNDEMTAKSAAIKSILVIAFSFAYFTYASAVISTPANIVMGMRNGMMAIGASLMEGEAVTPEEAVAASTNNLHKIMIDNDWRMLQWGHIDVDEQRVKAILNNPQSSEIRKSAVELEAKPVKDGGFGNVNMTIQANFIRTFFIVGSIIKNLFIGLVVGNLALAGYIFQLMYLFIAVLGPLALIWAVNPKMIQSAERWAAEGLGALMMIFAVGVVLAVYFLVSDMVYRLYQEDGYVKIIVSQLALIALMIWKRSLIFDLATSPAMALVGKVGETDRMDRMLNMAGRYMRLKNYRGYGKGRRERGSGKRHRGQSETIEPEVNADRERERPSLVTGKKKEKGGQEEGKNPAEATDKEQASRPSLKDGSEKESVEERRVEMEKNAEMQAKFQEEASRNEELEKREKERVYGGEILPDPEIQPDQERRTEENEESIPSDEGTRPSLYSLEEGEKK